MHPTEEQQEALNALFEELDNMLNDGIEAIMGNRADVVVVVHPTHEGEEPCNGAVVMSNCEDIGVTYLVMTHGMVTIGKHMASAEPVTKH